MIVYDVHVHVGDKPDDPLVFRMSTANDRFIKTPLPFKVGLRRRNTIDDYLTKMQKAGVSKTLIFPFVSGDVDIVQANKEIMKSVQRAPDKLYPLLSLPGDLSSIPEGRFYGFKQHFRAHTDLPKEQKFAAYDYLQKHDMVLLIHEQGPLKIETLTDIRKNFPTLKVIIAHSGRKVPYTGEDIMERMIPLFGADQNFYFETSTTRASSVIKQMVEAIGSERILFGSDTPYMTDEEEDSYALEIKTVTDAGLAAGDEENVLYKNFARLFGI